MSTFGRSVIREIGRNVGKGISNDLFGDWHATPIRGVSSKFNSIGFDLSYVDPSEYDVSEQPFFTRYKRWESIIFPLLGTILIIPIAFIWLEILYHFFQRNTNLYARVPSRKRDGRTKVGYRESGSFFIKLKSKRKLSEEEKSRLRLNGTLFLIIHLLTIGFVYYLNLLILVE